MKATEALGKTDAGGLNLRILTSSLALFLLSFGLLFAKSPDALLRPQLWAEDGAIFYAQQLGRSWPQLFVPYAGYMNFIPRLVAWLLAGVSPAHIPLSYNFSAIILSAACITCAVKTMSPLFGPGVALSAFFLTPDIGDIFGSITNIQWFAQFGLIFAVFVSSREQRPSVPRRVAVVLFIFAAALSGPFSVFDAAVIALLWSAAAVGRRMNLGPRFVDPLRELVSNLDPAKIVVLFLCAFVQLATMLRMGVHTPEGPAVKGPEALRFINTYSVYLDTINHPFRLAQLSPARRLCRRVPVCNSCNDKNLYELHSFHRAAVCRSGLVSPSSLMQNSICATCFHLSRTITTFSE